MLKSKNVESSFNLMQWNTRKEKKIPPSQRTSLDSALKLKLIGLNL